MYHSELKNCIALLYPEAAGYDTLLASLADFIKREIRPGAAIIDREEIYPRENLCKLAERGVPALPFSQELGGGGLPYPVFVAVMEMLAAGCANTALQLSIQAMVCEGILLFGNESQKESGGTKHGHRKNHGGGRRDHGQRHCPDRGGLRLHGCPGGH